MTTKTKFHFSFVLCSLILIFASLNFFDPFPISYADTFQSNSKPVPEWIQNIVFLWVDEQINDDEFLRILEHLAIYDFVSVDDQSVGTNSKIPLWIKNSATWWLNGAISDSTFLSSLEWLIENQILHFSDRYHSVNYEIESITFTSIVPSDYEKYIHLNSALFPSFTFETLSSSPILGLDPNKMEHYSEISLWKEGAKKAAVVFPIFTSYAYSENGFYDYYNDNCDSCTTTKFKSPELDYTTSGNAIQIFMLLGYDFLSDVEIDQNPSILKNYDAIIMLHNEYVTKTIFDAVTNHTNVIYLYPNALYAEISVNYVDETITLIRGHGYPDSSISNGFDWDFDNTHPYEFDNECDDWNFYSIPNGSMMNCYPEHILYLNEDTSFSLLKEVKEIVLNSTK